MDDRECAATRHDLHRMQQVLTARGVVGLIVLFAAMAMIKFFM